MSIPTRLTGKNVIVNGVSTLGHIRHERSATANPMFPSNANGGADRDAGNIRNRGYYYAWGHTPPTFPGKTFDLSFTVTGVTGGGTGEVASITGSGTTGVMCTMLEVFVPVFDPKQQNRVYYVVHYGPNGNDLVLANAAPPTDATTVIACNVKGLSTLLDNMSGTAEDGVTEMHLQIRNMAEESIDSSYNGLWFVPSGNIDWTYRYRRNISSIGALPTINSIHEIGMQVVATTGSTQQKIWDLQWGRVLEEIGVYDRETRKPLATDIIVEKCMNVTDVSATDIGFIKDPAGTTQWPS